MPAGGHETQLDETDQWRVWPGAWSAPATPGSTMATVKAPSAEKLPAGMTVMSGRATTS